MAIPGAKGGGTRHQSFPAGMFILSLCIALLIGMIVVGYVLFQQITADLNSAFFVIEDVVLGGVSGIVVAEQYIQDKSEQAISTISSQTQSVVDTVASAITSIVNSWIDPDTGFIAQTIALIDDQVVPLVTTVIATMIPIVDGIEALISSIMNFIYSLAGYFIDFINGVIDLIVGLF